jgi:hypothetical protein
MCKRDTLSIYSTLLEALGETLGAHLVQARFETGGLEITRLGGFCLHLCG